MAHFHQSELPACVSPIGAATGQEAPLAFAYVFIPVPFLLLVHQWLISIGEREGWGAAIESEIFEAGARGLCCLCGGAR